MVENEAKKESRKALFFCATSKFPLGNLEGSILERYFQISAGNLEVAPQSGTFQISCGNLEVAQKREP